MDVNAIEKECRRLRQSIQAIRIKRLDWSDETFYFIMAGLGYGTSLRELGYHDLKELHGILSSYKRDAAAAYDKQGKFMYAQQMRAGWSDSQLRDYMCRHFYKLHWNVLDKDERQKLINTLQVACMEER